MHRYTLGLDAYVQFSSPIRRYTDMLAHYQVKVGLLQGLPLPILDGGMYTRTTVFLLPWLTEDVAAAVALPSCFCFSSLFSHNSEDLLLRVYVYWKNPAP